MQVEEELAGLVPEKDTLLTIGVFDGVHLGHKHLLSQLKKEAQERGLLTGAVTFRQHPQALLQPQTKRPFLTSLEERAELLKNEGINIVVILSFNPELAQVSARHFISLLQKYLRMRGLVVGPDFALGRDREGDIPTLRKLGQEMGFTVTVVPPLVVSGGVPSSTAIRRALAEGDMEKVRLLAGRYFSLSARVIFGAGRGKGLGFPTANLGVSAEQALPADGVYASLVKVNDSSYPSVTNIGTCPTFNGKERTVEVYLINYQNNLYGRQIKLDVIERLREERRFNTSEELSEQMARDVEQARALLAQMEEHGHK